MSNLSIAGERGPSMHPVLYSSLGHVDELWKILPWLCEFLPFQMSAFFTLDNFPPGQYRILPPRGSPGTSPPSPCLWSRKCAMPWSYRPSLPSASGSSTRSGWWSSSSRPSWGTPCWQGTPSLGTSRTSWWRSTRRRTTWLTRLISASVLVVMAPCSMRHLSFNSRWGLAT